VSSRLRVLIGGEAMLGSMSGIGYYAWNLATALAGLEEVERVGVISPLGVRSLWWFCRWTASHSGRRCLGALRRVVKRAVPGSRALVGLVRRALTWRAADPARWDLYHEPNYIPAFRFGGPLVITVCDLAFMRYPEFLPAERLAWLRKGLKRSLEAARVVLTISQFSRKELLEFFPGLPPEKVRVTRLGVDAQFANARFDEGGAEALRRRLGLPGHFILFLGTLEPRKNLQGLLRAYDLLPGRLRRRFPLVLAGMQGWRQAYYAPFLDKLLRQRAAILTGYVRRCDVPALMRAASAFCFPSFYEGFGLPPLEAAACGTPVVCSNRAALPEVMGDAAVYVDPDSPEKIAAAIRAVLEDDGLRRSLSEKGPARASSFTWTNCARQTLEAYRLAISRDLGCAEPALAVSGE